MSLQYFFSTLDIFFGLLSLRRARKKGWGFEWGERACMYHGLVQSNLSRISQLYPS